jgi:hypothetical protein
MKLWHLKWLSGFAGGVVIGIILAGQVFAVDISADTLKLAPGVMKAAEGFETSPATYVVANPTSVFNNHFFYDTKVTGELKRGEKVETLAKVKGYGWVLIGKNGMGIGYVPISMLAPENLYRS